MTRIFYLRLFQDVSFERAVFFWFASGVHKLCNKLPLARERVVVDVPVRRCPLSIMSFLYIL
jgi:hypothetical protein